MLLLLLACCRTMARQRLRYQAFRCWCTMLLLLLLLLVSLPVLLLLLLLPIHVALSPCALVLV
jgi:heme A synthase